MVLAVKFKFAPTQSGPLLVAIGAAGIGFTVTAVVAAGLVQPETVEVTEYAPAPAKVIPATLGF